MDLHILYAVVRWQARELGGVRLSEPLPWAQAVDAHTALHARPIGSGKRRDWRYNRRVLDPGYTVCGAPVAYFSVRAANDPAWPADGPNVHATLRAV